MVRDDNIKFPPRKRSGKFLNMNYLECIWIKFLFKARCLFLTEYGKRCSAFIPSGFCKRR